MAQSPSPSPSPSPLDYQPDEVELFPTTDFAKTDPSFYVCSQAQWQLCTEYFDICAGSMGAMESAETYCKCWTDAYICYRDCGYLPARFDSRCKAECASAYCEPPMRDLASGASHRQGGRMLAWLLTATGLITGLALLAGNAAR